MLPTFEARRRLPSRSTAVQYAIRLLRLPDLEAGYAAAWEEWEASGDSEAWATTSTDGLGDAAR